ncbi:MAG: PD-(D/E)XK nuclease family protein [Burkholderiales bacterium]|nr:PD-(D/E)XK nuclease family protein [Burkholderiales bacterium]
MTPLAWVSLGFVALFGTAVIAVLARLRWHAAGKVSAERASLPAELRDAELVYVERLFRVSEPVRLAAKLDRAYRLPSGVIVLVEFKSRWIDQPFLSDVVQLSAQRLALEGQTRQAVAPYGYVVIKRPGRAARHAAHRVELLRDEVVVALVRRREDILAGRVRPRHAASTGTCRTCAFRSECHRQPVDAVGRDHAAKR